jgi:DNA-binding NarL/FixJ family response regulator
MGSFDATRVRSFTAVWDGETLLYTHDAQPDQIPELVEFHAPHLICFDYNHPTDAELASLRQTKRLLPSIPILMLTSCRSGSLVAWALRARVWDYIAKPWATEDIVRAAQAIVRVGRKRNDTRRGREVIFPLQGDARASKPKRAARIVQKARSYVIKHLGEEFQLRKVAQHCCVSQSHLSRIWK